MGDINEIVLEGVALINEKGMSQAGAAKHLFDRVKGNMTLHALRQRIASAHRDPSSVSVKKAKPAKKGKKKEPKPFVLCAWNDETGKMMDLDEYCSHYSLPRDQVHNWRLVSHTGTPFYNISFREVENGYKGIDIEAIKTTLESELSKTYVPVHKEVDGHIEGVLKLADLHFGAHIRNLVLTADYDSDILSKSLHRAADTVNSLSFAKCHVHINGDLIESLSGLNHINSWMSMDKDQVGPNAIMLCVKLLHEIFSKIVNLGEIKIIGGNHDRLSKNNDEEVKGGAAELIAWGLRLMGYSVEFHSYIITHQVNGINHINLHGDKVLSKRSTKEIIWKYGRPEKGVFNYIFEAHLHSVAEKLSASQIEKFETITDDNVDYRRMRLPSLFTGNYYSETLGVGANAGYVVVSDNGEGKPNTLIYSL